MTDRHGWGTRARVRSASKWWRLLVGIVGLIALGSVLLFFAGVQHVNVTVIRPDAVIVEPAGSGTDPNVVYIRFRWTAAGYCSGQFSVQATETDQVVRVSDVVSRDYVGASCAGLGTVGNVATATLTLRQPLGTRTVERASDGTRLPVMPAGPL